MKYNNTMDNRRGQTSPGWILILIFIFIMAGTIGIIIYNQTSIKEVKIPVINKQQLITNISANSTIDEPPTIINSSDYWQNISNETDNETYQ